MTNIDIGSTIKRLRQEKGITQYHLAECLNVSMQTVSRWETSATYPDITMLPSLAQYFHVTVDHLLNMGGNSSMKPMESENLLLREWSDNDAAALLAMKQSSKNFMYYLQLETVNDSLDCIATWKKYQEMYPVVRKETHHLMGVAGLVDVGRYDGYREIEVHICDQFHHVDCVTEAHKLMLRYGFEDLGLKVAFACVECDDQMSKQAMENAGFVCEGTLRKFGRDGKDRLRYSILKEEYEK